MTAFVAHFAVAWPAAFHEFSEHFLFINLDIVSATAPCMDEVNYYNRMTVTVVTPLILSVGIVVGCKLLEVCRIMENWMDTAISQILLLIFLVLTLSPWVRVRVSVKVPSVGFIAM